MQYVVVYEQSPNNWAAYVPDLPRCVAAGDSRDEDEKLICKEISLHVASIREANEPVPQPGSSVGLVDIDEDEVKRLVGEFRAERSSGRSRGKKTSAAG